MLVILAGDRSRLALESGGVCTCSSVEDRHTPLHGAVGVADGFAAGLVVAAVGVHSAVRMRLRQQELASELQNIGSSEPSTF